MSKPVVVLIIVLMITVTALIILIEHVDIAKVTDTITDTVTNPITDTIIDTITAQDAHPCKELILRHFELTTLDPTIPISESDISKYQKELESVIQSYSENNCVGINDHTLPEWADEEFIQIVREKLFERYGSYPDW